MEIKRILFFISMLFCSFWSTGQVFEGWSVDGNQNYHCLFQIKPDSTIVYSYDRWENAIYGEYVGKIRHLKEDRYLINAQLEIGQYIMKSFDKDTIYVKLSPKIATTLDIIQIEYSNGKDRKQFQGSDPKGKPVSIVKMPVDKSLFNTSVGKDYIKITVNRRNRITRDWVSFKIPFGSAASITSGEKLELEVEIKSGVIRTVGEKPVQTGHVELKQHKSK